MDFTIRRAKREDCPEILELVRELAVFERAPDEVTVSLQHFEESGFGDKPVWWAFVACAPIQQAQEASSLEQEEPTTAIQDPVLASLISSEPEQIVGEPAAALQEPADTPLSEPGIQLEGSVTPTLPDPVQEALSLVREAMPCEKVIGFALYYIRFSTWKGQRMYLEDILVTESWRGKGVGTALMDALIGAAKAEGLHGISWQVLEWNEPAMKFYERYSPRVDKEWVNLAIDV